jgi:hypothetical protein
MSPVWCQDDAAHNERSRTLTEPIAHDIARADLPRCKVGASRRSVSCALSMTRFVKRTTRSLLRRRPLSAAGGISGVRVRSETEDAPALVKAAAQELLIGARARQSQRLPPGALGGGVLAEAEVELAEDRVPAGIAGGDVFRGNGGQATASRTRTEALFPGPPGVQRTGYGRSDTATGYFARVRHRTRRWDERFAAGTHTVGRVLRRRRRARIRLLPGAAACTTRCGDGERPDRRATAERSVAGGRSK